MMVFMNSHSKKKKGGGVETKAELETLRWEVEKKQKKIILGAFLLMP